MLFFYGFLLVFPTYPNYVCSSLCCTKTCRRARKQLHAQRENTPEVRSFTYPSLLHLQLRKHPACDVKYLSKKKRRPKLLFCCASCSPYPENRRRNASLGMSAMLLAAAKERRKRYPAMRRRVREWGFPSPPSARDLKFNIACSTGVKQVKAQ